MRRVRIEALRQEIGEVRKSLSRGSRSVYELLTRHELVACYARMKEATDPHMRTLAIAQALALADGRRRAGITAGDIQPFDGPAGRNLTPAQVTAFAAGVVRWTNSP